jgi:hypothetical protein
MGSCIYYDSSLNAITLHEHYISEIIRITGTCGFCFAWVKAIAQRTLKKLCGWWRYVGFWMGRSPSRRLKK